jgi:glycosyltransferase involved in cell wall biosynthesis
MGSKEKATVITETSRSAEAHTSSELRVSVIIPAHNEQLHIRDCLNSLLNQSLPANQYELITIDDGSKDRTPSILEEYSHNYPKRVSFHTQNHGGPALARNYGARLAKGKILSFLDADMKFAPDFLEKLILPIEKGEAVGTFTLDEYVANPHNLWSRSWSVNFYLPKDRRTPDNVTENESTVFRAIGKADFMRVGGFDSTGYHDDRTVAIKLGASATRVPGAICYHYNPGTLKEVFASAKWMAKSDKWSGGLKEWLRRSPPGALKRGIMRAWEEKEPFYVVFEQVFSLAVIIGMLQRRWLKGDHAR